jgi:hypothetical protein
MTTAATKLHNDSMAILLAAFAANAIPDQATLASCQEAIKNLKTPKVKLPKEPKVKASKVAAPGGVAPSALDGIVVGSLDAAGFIAAIRAAGMVDKVLPSGATIRVQSGDKAKIANDHRAALAAFVGVTAEPMGVQLSNATRKAQFALRPTVGSDKRHADPTLSGFVAGMPNFLAKQIADLAAREVLAAEALANAERMAREATDPSMVAIHNACAYLESGRLVAIREELAKLV